MGDSAEARDSGWQWHQLGHMLVCTTSLQTGKLFLKIFKPAPHHSSFFTGRMPFLPPNQQHQGTEGIYKQNRWSKNSDKNVSQGAPPPQLAPSGDLDPYPIHGSYTTTQTHITEYR